MSAKKNSRRLRRDINQERKDGDDSPVAHTRKTKNDIVWLDNNTIISARDTSVHVKHAPKLNQKQRKTQPTSHHADFAANTTPTTYPLINSNPQPIWMNENIVQSRDNAVRVKNLHINNLKTNRTSPPPTVNPIDLISPSLPPTNDLLSPRNDHIDIISTNDTTEDVHPNPPHHSLFYQGPVQKHTVANQLEFTYSGKKSESNAHLDLSDQLNNDLLENDSDDLFSHGGDIPDETIRKSELQDDYDLFSEDENSGDDSDVEGYSYRQTGSVGYPQVRLRKRTIEKDPTHDADIVAAFTSNGHTNRQRVLEQLYYNKIATLVNDQQQRYQTLSSVDFYDIHQNPGTRVLEVTYENRIVELQVRDASLDDPITDFLVNSAYSRDKQHEDEINHPNQPKLSSNTPVLCYNLHNAIPSDLHTKLQTEAQAPGRKLPLNNKTKSTLFQYLIYSLMTISIMAILLNLYHFKYVTSHLPTHETTSETTLALTKSPALLLNYVPLITTSTPTAVFSSLNALREHITQRFSHHAKTNIDIPFESSLPSALALFHETIHFNVLSCLASVVIITVAIFFEMIHRSKLYAVCYISGFNKTRFNLPKLSSLLHGGNSDHQKSFTSTIYNFITVNLIKNNIDTSLVALTWYYLAGQMMLFIGIWTALTYFIFDNMIFAAPLVFFSYFIYTLRNTPRVDLIDSTYYYLHAKGVPWHYSLNFSQEFSLTDDNGRSPHTHDNTMQHTVLRSTRDKTRASAANIDDDTKDNIRVQRTPPTLTSVNPAVYNSPVAISTSVPSLVHHPTIQQPIMHHDRIERSIASFHKHSFQNKMFSFSLIGTHAVSAIVYAFILYAVCGLLHHTYSHLFDIPNIYDLNNLPSHSHYKAHRHNLYKNYFIGQQFRPPQTISEIPPQVTNPIHLDLGEENSTFHSGTSQYYQMLLSTIRQKFPESDIAHEFTELEKNDLFIDNNNLEFNQLINNRQSIVGHIIDFVYSAWYAYHHVAHDKILHEQATIVQSSPDITTTDYYIPNLAPISYFQRLRAVIINAVHFASVSAAYNWEVLKVLFFSPNNVLSSSIDDIGSFISQKLHLTPHTIQTTFHITQEQEVTLSQMKATLLINNVPLMILQYSYIILCIYCALVTLVRFQLCGALQAILQPCVQFLTTLITMKTTTITPIPPSTSERKKYHFGNQLARIFTECCFLTILSLVNVFTANLPFIASCLIFSILELTKSTIRYLKYHRLIAYRNHTGEHRLQWNAINHAVEQYNTNQQNIQLSNTTTN